MIINNFNIDTSTLPQEETTRAVTVNGGIGAEFMILAIQNPSSSSAQTLYYNFSTGLFAAGHNNLNNNLIVTLKSNVHINTITFPSGAGDFIVTLTALNNTILQNNKGGVASRAITKLTNNSTVTFTPASVSSANYTTPPTTTRTAALGSTSAFDFNWNITNVSTDAKGFGLRLKEDSLNIDDSYWYCNATKTINNLDHNIKNGLNKEATSTSTTFTLSDSSDLSLVRNGDFVYGAGVTVGTVVSSDVGENITLSAEMSIAEGATLEFVTPSFKFFVDDATGITTGMEISSVSGTFAHLVGTPVVVGVDKINNNIKLSTLQAFADNTTLTLKASGIKNIKRATGLDFTVNKHPIITPTVLTKTVRADGSVGDEATDGSNVKIALNGTYGVAGGNHVTFNGVGVDNETATTVSAITTPSSTAGLITVSRAQSLEAGSVITFKGCNQTLNVSGVINILNHPVVNETIYLDLDKFITVGTA